MVGVSVMAARHHLSGRSGDRRCRWAARCAELLKKASHVLVLGKSTITAAVIRRGIAAVASDPYPLEQPNTR
jgi:hypothetical protein